MLTKEQKIQEDQYKFPYHYIPRFVDEKYFSQHFSWSWGLKYYSTLQFLISKIDGLSIKSICDVGCGDGRFISELSMTNKNYKLVGIDYSERSINIARALNPGLDFRQFDILSNPINESFHLVTLIEVFEHIPLEYTQVFLEKVLSMVAKNGYFIMTVPHLNKSLNPKHVQHFNIERLKDYLDPYCNIEEVILFEKMSRLSSVLHLMLHNKFFILNNKIIVNYIYNFYKKRLFFASENDCGRIFLKCKKRN